MRILKRTRPPPQPAMGGGRDGGNPGRAGRDAKGADGDELEEDLKRIGERRHDDLAYFPSKRPDCGGDCGVGRPRRS